MGYHDNKLVRDKIPDRILEEGKRPVWMRVSGSDFRHVILMKVIEEAREYDRHPSPEEEADVQEVFLAARGIYGYSREDVDQAYDQLQESDFHSSSAALHAAAYIRQPSALTEADVQAVFAVTRDTAGYTANQAEAIRIQKAQTRGAFEMGIYLQYVDGNKN